MARPHIRGKNMIVKDRDKLYEISKEDFQRWLENLHNKYSHDLFENFNGKLVGQISYDVTDYHQEDAVHCLGTLLKANVKVIHQSFPYVSVDDPETRFDLQETALGWDAYIYHKGDGHYFGYYPESKLYRTKEDMIKEIEKFYGEIKPYHD